MSLLPEGFHLGSLAPVVEARLEAWHRGDLPSRFFAKDASLWPPGREEVLRMGWLDLPTRPAADLQRFVSLAEEVRAKGLRRVVVLGMGGSSLAAEVFFKTLGSPSGVELTVCDSTHPAAVLQAAEDIDRAGLDRTFFLVSSKSGATLETLSLFRFFWDRSGRALPQAGQRFVAITDSGSPLEDVAHEHGFRGVISPPADVGGRFSALTAFGLLPCALLGLDLGALLANAASALQDEAGGSAGSSAGEAGRSPKGLALGALLSEMALGGLGKLTLLTSPGLSAFPTWLDQLVAESLGKYGQGVLPVAHEPLGALDAYGDDRVFVALKLGGDRGDLLDSFLDDALAAGRPVIEIVVERALDLGGEMLRWEVAVAAAASAIGVYPFDQPDVELAKDLARRAMAGEAPEDGRPGSAHESTDASIDVGDGAAVREALQAVLGGTPPSYVAVQAFLHPTEDAEMALRRLQARLRDATGVAVTAAFGPRYLHSSGQLHKGGPAGGLHLQLLDRPAREVPVPDMNYSFRRLIRAQADGDAAALAERGRAVLRIDLGGEAVAGIDRVAALCGAATSGNIGGRRRSSRRKRVRSPS